MAVSVSVVIPCYRCSGTIKRALDSVLRQTTPVLEVIIVDDCSADGTLERVQGLAASCAERVRVIALPQNSGPATARNAGWEASSGDFVAFLDADDAWHSSKIEVQHALMMSHPEFALCGHAHLWLRPGEEAPVEVPTGSSYSEVRLAALMLSNRFTTSSMMVRRLVRQRFNDGQRHMEDHLLWLNMVSSGLRAVRLQAPLSYRYSAPFGESGLSRNLLSMEREELTNYVRLCRSGEMNAFWLAALVPWSLVKFARRLVVTGLRTLI